MYSDCVKHAENLCRSLGETCARLYTGFVQSLFGLVGLWVNTPVFRPIVHKMYTAMSTLTDSIFHLVARDFSPLSTVPIIRTTNLKKENN